MEPYTLIFGRNSDTGEYVALPRALLTHAHFKGMTGHGKSSLLVHLVASLILQGVGVTLIDPAGDLSRQVLIKLSKHRYFEKHADAFERVVYLDVPRAQRLDTYFPMNVLSGTYDPYTAANVVLEGYKRIWPNLQDGTSTNIETLLKIGAYVLADNKLPFLPYFEELYTNAQFQEALLSKISDRQIKRQFDTMDLKPSMKDGRYKIPEIASTSLKREYLLSFSPVVRYALAQQANIFDFGNLLDSGRSVLVNLRIADPDAKRLIGCLITEQLEAVAKSRGDLTAEQKKRRYAVVIDEMQNFIYQSGLALENLFAEARKAGVAVWVAHQYGMQLSDSLNAAISQCDIKVAFKLGYEDAVVSVKQMGFPIHTHWIKQALGNPYSASGEHYQFYSESEQWTHYAQTIGQMTPREAYVQLPGNHLHRIRTLDVASSEDIGRVEEIENEYLRRYFRTRGDIEQEIEATLAGLTPTSAEHQKDTIKQPATVQSPHPHQARQNQPVPQPAANRGIGEPPGKTTPSQGQASDGIASATPPATQSSELVPGKQDIQKKGEKPQDAFFSKDEMLDIPEDDDDLY